MQPKEIAQLLESQVPLVLRNVFTSLLWKPSYKLSLEDFILLFLEGLKTTHETIYSDTGLFQCKHDANRSTGDFYLMAKNYFPEITFEEFLYTLLKLADEYKITGFFCPQIRKRVWRVSKPHTESPKEYHLFQREISTDEYGLSNSDYKEWYENYNK